MPSLRRVVVLIIAMLASAPLAWAQAPKPAGLVTALESGKFALAVARDRMQPGDRIDIRTPNAVAGVRGTVVVTETQGSLAAPDTLLTSFFLLQGSLQDVSAVDPATQTPIGTARTLNPMEQFRVAGVAPGTVSPIAADQLGAIRSGLQPRGSKPQAPPDMTQAMATAATLASLLTSGGDPLGILNQALFPTQAGTPDLAESEPNSTIASTGFSSPASPGGQDVGQLAFDLANPPPTNVTGGNAG